VKNVGRGIIVEKDSVLKTCSSSSQTRGDFNNVSITAQLGNTKLTCDPKVIKIVEGLNNNYARCYLEQGIVDLPRNYLSLLSAELSYGYMESTSKKFNILRRG